MSEIRDRVIQKIAEILYGELTYKNYLTIPKVRHNAELKIEQILSIPELAVVDREAKLPEVGEDNPFVRLDEQGKMLEASWVKEVVHVCGHILSPNK